MTRVIVLDSGPLGMLTNPRAKGETRACHGWFLSLLERGVRFIVPEIADYEVRRNLLLEDLAEAVRRLDELAGAADYLPLTTEVMRSAAGLWARTRKQGRPTAAPDRLDGDVILAAQTLSLAETLDNVIVATSNVKHLSMFVAARRWQDLK